MRRVTFLLVPLFLLACDGQPVAPDIAPTFSIANAPPESGIVVRAGYPFGVTWGDPKSDLRVFLGLDIVEYCSGNVDFDVLPFADKELDGRLVTLGQGTVQTSVWQGAGWSCPAILTTKTLLATGMADLVYTDNDVLQSGANNTNAWGFMAHGFLTRPDGSGAVFSAQRRVSFSQIQGFRVLTSKITLN